MQVNKCVIIASGTIGNIFDYKKIIKEADLIICADGGLRYLDMLSINPHVILGDFDSVDLSLIEKYRNRNIKIYDYPTRKDATDSELAIDLAIENQPKEVIMLGVVGTRMDHTLINMQMLIKFDGLGIDARIINDNNVIYFVNKKITIKGKINDQVSIVAITDKIIGITTKGLEYPLAQETISFGESRGVSNVFSSEEIEIDFESGKFFLIIAND